MKNILVISLLFLLSCNQSTDVKLENLNDLDSVLILSNKNLMLADTVAKKSDSTTKEQIVLVISEIKYLTKEIDRYKTEKITLESKLKETSEKVIYRVDTVYIETKRNFWGKEKTAISTKSDSTIQINSDTLVQNTQSIDTLKVNQ